MKAIAMRAAYAAVASAALIGAIYAGQGYAVAASTEGAPNAAIKVSSVKQKVLRSGAYLTSRVEVPGAGRISQRATTGSRKLATRCRASRKVDAASTYTLKCNLGAKGRRILKKYSLNLTLRTSFRSREGDVANSRLEVTMERQPGSLPGGEKPPAGRDDQPSGGEGQAPPKGAGWVVSIGDSFISGEGGRWAGNSNRSSGLVDALGPSAYLDNASGTAEQIKGCHRARSAPVHIGTDLAQSANLACSGARSATRARDGDGNFKPGIDFYSGPEGVGQLVALREFARANRVKMVAVSIGGNDFNFGPTITTCVQNFLTSLSAFPRLCRNDAGVKANFTEANIAASTDGIRRAYVRIGRAMREAGYRDADYDIVAISYPEIIAPSALNRFPQRGYDRQRIGGCGLYDADIDWFLDDASPKIQAAMRGGATASGLGNIHLLALKEAYRGHRLCERGAALVEDGPGSWSAPGAVDSAEWVNQIRTADAVFGAYDLYEGFHPNYWGLLAVRSCLRAAWSALSANRLPRSASCVQDGGGLNGRGAPPMKLID